MYQIKSRSNVRSKLLDYFFNSSRDIIAVAHLVQTCTCVTLCDATLGVSDPRADEFNRETYLDC